ncbi:MAG: methylated-DNA--[protein]-cysteine S-methyltransferase [Candidatus Bathyarchaeia archaeon]
MLYYDCFDTPIGRLWFAATPKGLCRIRLASSEEEFLTSLKRAFEGEPKREERHFKGLIERFKAYFRGEPTSFSDVPLDLRGTDFQKAVWRAVVETPYGRLSTYREVAIRVGRPRAYRAAGNAVGRNPLFIVVPCHRVVRSDGSLGGFGSSGIELKKYLLRLEGLDLLRK